MPGPIDIEVEPRTGPSTNRPGCTFRIVNGRRTKRKSLVALLAKATTPILIENLAESWPGYDALMAQHGSLAVEAVHNESVADAARALLERGGANPEVANSQEGLTPLMMAAKHGHLGVVSALLDAGARVDARDRDGRSAEDVAGELGRQSVLEVLRDARRQKGEL